MPSSPPVNTVISRFRIPILLAFIASGLAGNYFNYSLFLNIDFLFGSIFAMLALQFFAPGLGILAAAIIASSTYLLWNHPYAIIIMTAEVAIVGWQRGRRKRGLVMADTLYWLIIGMPLVYLFYHGIMHVSVSNTYIAMIKQAVNGITNTLIARLVFTAYSLRSRSSLTSYSDIAYNLMAFFVLCPALIMLATSSRTDFNEADSKIRTELIQDSKNLSSRLKVWVGNRKLSITNLAELAASRSPQEMQTYIEQAKKSDDNYLRIGLANKEAISVAFFPLLDEKGKSTIGVNFAERPYVPILQQTLKPMLSEVIMGKVGILKPRALMLAPVVIGGKYNGYVFGVLDFGQIQDLLDENSGHTAILYTLLDKNGNVITTNRTDQTVRTPFVRGKGALNTLDTQLSQWVPDTPLNTPISERWTKSYYVTTTVIGELAEWKLILEQPVAPFQKNLYNNYSGKLIQMFLILLGALALAELLSRRFITTLEKLRLITHDLPIQLAKNNDDIIWPESGIMETHHLINNFREMSKSLMTQFNEIQQVNQSLEQRVSERTAELSESEKRYRSILNVSPVPIALNDEQQHITFLNPAFVQTFGYIQEDIPTLTHWWSQAYPDLAYRQKVADTWRAKIEATMLTGAAFSPFEVTVRCKDLTSKTVLITATSIPNTFEGNLLVMLYDITERKLTEDALWESKENYSRVFENQMIAICIFDVETLQIIDVNSSHTRLYGYSREELLSGMTLPDLSGEPETSLDSIRSAKSQKTFSLPLRYHKKKDGTIFPVEIVGETYLRNGRPVMLGMVRDITNRLQKDKELQTSLVEKEVLLREVHHRVKNNMAAIVGLLDLQRQSMDDPNAQMSMTDLSSRVRAMSLVHEKLYRSESLSKIDFQEYLQSLILHLRTSFGSPNIKCDIDAHGVEMPLDLAVPCGMIVNELIINALKYAFPKERSGLDAKEDRILVTLHHDHDTVSLSVADNGVGLPPEFDLNTTTSLGLSLVQMLGQHQLGGRYVVDQIGSGTRFTLTFSLQDGEKPYA